MGRMIVIYKTPKSKITFDKHYFEVHVPMAENLPGLRKHEVSSGPIISHSGHSEIYLVTTLYFDSLNAIKTAFASEQGQACMADRKILVPDDDDVQVYLFHTNEV